jgi:6-phosphogluconolactonase (cycloisomerase 2 family)
MKLTRPQHLSFATVRTLTLAVCASLMVVACGGQLDSAGDTISTGNSGNGSIGGNGTASSSSSSGGALMSYTIGGNVINLSGTGLVLADNAGNSLPIAGNGGFTFPGSIAGGATYVVSVQSQPVNASQICTVLNGAGTVGTVNVTSIVVSCTTNYYTVGGSVSGLAGSGLVLQTNGSNNTSVSSSGNYTFANLASGTNYAVTVMTQPSNPSQTCVVANGMGTVTSANVKNVAISCTTNSYTVGGNVTGLSGSGLVLQTNGANNLPVSASSPYTFATLPSGTAYTVTVQTQPSNPAQFCLVTNGSGTVTDADLTNVAVTCRTTGKFVFVSNTYDGPSYSLSAFTINAQTGALTAVAGSSPLATTGMGPEGIAVDASGADIYVAESLSAEVDTYSVDTASGALAYVGSTSTGTATNLPFAIAIDPSGLHAYVGSRDSPTGTLEAYTINAGTLTPLAGPPAPPYLADTPLGVLVDPNDQFVFASDAYEGTLSGFLVGTGGTLTALSGSPFPFQSGIPANSPYAITVYPTGGYLYITDSGYAGNTVTAYSYDSAGTLMELATPLAVGTAPRSVAIDPSGRFLYVANTGDGTVTAFNIDAKARTLGLIGTLATGGGASTTTTAVTVDPSGQYVYVANGDGGSVSAFSINETSGALTEIGTLMTGAVTSPYVSAQYVVVE